MSGGGIYRKTWLHSAPPVHLQSDGIFAHGHVATSAGSDDNVGHAIVHRPHPSLGATATSAEVIASAEVINTARTTAKATIQFALFDASGKAVASTVSSSVSLDAASNTSSATTAITPIVKIPVVGPELWSVARPYLYTLQVTTDSGDATNVSIGIYGTKWTGDQGFFLNEVRPIRPSCLVFGSDRFSLPTNTCSQAHPTEGCRLKRHRLTQTEALRRSGASS